MLTLPEEIRKIVIGYTPTALVYLDSNGLWRKNPKTLCERISNELWHQIWSVGDDQQFISEINGIVALLQQAPSIKELLMKIDEAAVPASEKSHYLLRLYEFLHTLFAYISNGINCQRYLADWDLSGKTQKIFFSAKKQELLEILTNMLSEDRNSAQEIADNIGSAGNRLVNAVCTVIAEEEVLRYSVALAAGSSTAPEKIDKYYGQICARENLDLSLLTNSKPALLRPCCELLADAGIAMDSGLQFQMSSILGAIRDIRSLDTLLSTLERTDTRYTNVRCNVIYAIGHLRRKEARSALVRVLDEPEKVSVTVNDHQYDQSLDSEKCEAIWALGKLGAEAKDVIKPLLKLAGTNNRDLGVALAWAMGKIGVEQRKMQGGIDSRIMTILMNLLETHDIKIFEEIVSSMRNLGLPEFVYALYLHSIRAVSILALKPSSAGFFELSETFFHLLSVKKPVIMAVTGDSGTGKTYFCQTIKDGFGDIKKEDILYLMRDSQENRELFNRMLGLQWLKSKIDPQFYADYPLSEAEDNPDEFIRDFMDKNRAKKLIILDGWLDNAFFSPVIEAFHKKGFLDIMVNFRTTYSTRRMNLEEREELLENVRTCLSYVEGIQLEETELYYDDHLFIYCLDNSIDSRIGAEEIREIFRRRKIEQWGDHIRVGNFDQGTEALAISREDYSVALKKGTCSHARLEVSDRTHFFSEEGNFVRKLNDDLEVNPHLLQSIHFSALAVHRIKFFTHGQLAFCNDNGSVGILSGLNDHIFSFPTHQIKVRGLCVAGGDIYSFDENGDLKITSFKDNTIREIKCDFAPVNAIATSHYGKIVTGHQDGTLSTWNTRSKEAWTMHVSDHAIADVCVVSANQVCVRCQDGGAFICDLSGGLFYELPVNLDRITSISQYPGERVAVGAINKDGTRAEIMIADVKNGKGSALHVLIKGEANVLYSYPDGRIFTGIKTCSAGGLTSHLYMLDPRENFGVSKLLGQHGAELTDCLTMGPRIITCSKEPQGEHVLHIWGPESYVRTEYNKLKYLTEGQPKPPYYRVLF